MGLNVKQFREYVIKPTLEYIDLYSPSAENLLIGTALQESRLQYLDQLTPGPGPAYGLFQMEKATFKDHLRWLEYQPDLLQKINALRAPIPDGVAQLATNLMFAAAMCRVHYRRVNEKLPEADDVVGLGRYWKKYYNTYLGKGTVDEFVSNYRAGVK